MEDLSSAAAGIAHDINNELTLILNYLAMRNTEAARSATSRCALLTSTLLALCREKTVATGRWPVDLAAFLKDYAATLHLPEGIRLELDVPARPQPVQANPESLTRILTNLIRNACDAMAGTGTLQIRLAGALLVIEDSGPGIHPEDRQRVFEPWYSTKGAKGTGLGLPIVRELMEQQGGSVALNTSPGKGACFELRFQPCSDSGYRS